MSLLFIISFQYCFNFILYRSIRLWLKRDSGQFWPSICHYCPSGVTAVCYTKEIRRIFVGQENGTVSVRIPDIFKPFNLCFVNYLCILFVGIFAS